MKVNIADGNYQKLVVNGPFSYDQIQRINRHPTNLAALEMLLLPSTQDSQTTDLDLLINAGFTGDHLEKVLRHAASSRNLNALKKLLLPSTQDNQTTDLNLLTNAGFTRDQIVAAVGHGSGYKNLDALFNLVKDISISDFISSYPGAHDSIVILANGNSRSSHIAFLGTILSKEDLRKEIKSGLLLEDLCKNIKPHTQKQVQNLYIDTFTDLKYFCKEKMTAKNELPQRSASGKEEEPTSGVRRVNKRKLTSSSIPDIRKKRKAPTPVELDLITLPEKPPQGESLEEWPDHFEMDSLPPLPDELPYHLEMDSLPPLPDEWPYHLEMDSLPPLPDEWPYYLEMDSLPPLPYELPYHFEMGSLPPLPDEWPYHFNENQDSGDIAPISATASLLSRWGLFRSDAKVTPEMDLDNINVAAMLGNHKK
ncbi:hypothetical protein TUM19329_20210 [Legionella antarctica]|uniref:Uncharacterized protein n=1 Tax=Legionella antarctica TaxID=2708020 RepID=A0A6F8T684_9GAMM|nr:hypothetical protein [Legionella antarctica]BCA95660.1 hypothetical protein TUM19329_20210 [Legionella antarctica]